MRSTFAAAAVAALLPLTCAQTWSDCDPTKKTDRPSKPGLNSAEFFTDFTQGATAAKSWTATSNAIAYDGGNGALFRINKVGEGPTIASDFYIFFGRVDVKMKAAPGAGVVSSVVLQSDDLDEIDWEWIGSDAAQAQTNYFGKGNTTTYDRGMFHPVSAPQSQVHTYSVDWKPDTTEWLVDGVVIRTLKYADAVGGKNYPQTPMNVRLGNWVAGTPGNAQGTIDWAGGLTDFSKGPFDMYVQSVKVTNYNPAESYKYGDQSGSWQTIQKNGAPAEASKPLTSGTGTGSGTTGPSDNVPFQNGIAPGGSLAQPGNGSGSSGTPGSGSSGPGSVGSGSGPEVIYTTTTATTTDCSCTSKPTSATSGAPSVIIPVPAGGAAPSGGFTSTTLVRPSGTSNGTFASATASGPAQFTGAASHLEHCSMMVAGALGAVLMIL